MVDLNPKALNGYGLSASDVVNAINAQNLILPSGTAKIGTREYSVQLNSSPDTVEGLNNLPISAVNGAVVYVRDVAQVRDGFPVQTNIVSAGNRRASLLTVLKGGGASTIDVVRRVKEILPKIQATLPQELEDRHSVRSVDLRASRHRRRGARGGDRRRPDRADDSDLSRQLAQHADRRHVDPAVDSDVARSFFGALGYTINIMTLGGLALAVGILVDDATVEIENIHRNLALGKPIDPRDPRRRSADRRAGVRLDAVQSASCSCRWCFLAARRNICSRRWRWRWSSRCWRRTFYRARWCRRWCSICCASEVGTLRRRRRARKKETFSGASTARSTGASNECAKDTAPASRGRCIIAGWCFGEFGDRAGQRGSGGAVDRPGLFSARRRGQFRLHVRAPPARGSKRRTGFSTLSRPPSRASSRAKKSR